MSRFLLAIFSLFLLPSTLAAQDIQNEDIQKFERHYEGVLGTTLDLTFYGPELGALEAAADIALAEIARLDAIFSNYRSDSEVSRLNRERLISGASPEMLDIIELCALWERVSQNRFSCKLGRIIAIWNQAEQTQELPDRAQLLALAAATAGAQPQAFRGTRSISLPEPVELELSGIATGYILDQVFNLLHQKLPEATGIKLDIGGDAIYWGQPPLGDGWRVGIANPLTRSDADLLATLSTHNGRAITASGHTNRVRRIAGQEFSHIFDPATGWPVQNGIGAVAVAKSAVTSDAAATAMSLQTTVEDAAAWASIQPDLDALAIDASGHQAVSDQWKDFLAEEIVAENARVLTLNYTLPSFQTRGGYSRPYVAIWITDTRQMLRKNLLLLGEDQRWARENSRWWRQVGRSNPGLLDGTARPTRAPGEYQIGWDGLDENGKPLPAGEYMLHLEAARQDGGHNYLSLRFTLGAAQTLELPGEGELGRILLQIH
ncbi:MAG: DUF2271 domain-containing protein [Pseudomonadales bacterium]|jgi:thiamine biosynthesis lipoprotein|nr:DUF2271 domain-containing protein [Pseudomonadales bacterium]